MKIKRTILLACVGSAMNMLFSTPVVAASTIPAHLRPSFDLVWRINSEVNAQIRYVNDKGNVDDWRAAQNGFGDCEDFALEKRRRLLERGVSPEALRIAIARVKKSQFGPSEGHAVLIADTDQGEWILDVKQDLLRKQDVDYEWVKIQEGFKWRTITN